MVETHENAFVQVWPFFPEFVFGRSHICFGFASGENSPKKNDCT